MTTSTTGHDAAAQPVDGQWWRPGRLQVPGDAPDVLVEMAADFEPPVLDAATVLDPWRASALGGLLGRGALVVGDDLPLGWHEIWFRDPLASGGVAEDGHAEEHALMPRRRPRRRVYAGATLSQRHPFVVGDEVSRTSGVTDCRLVPGRTGWLMIITESHRYAVDGRLFLEETRRVALRHDAPADTDRATATPRAAADPAPSTADADLALEVTADPVMLFRFSALTYNPHRIHYDREYATGVEGHADLLVHGPLTALLALEAVRAAGVPSPTTARYDFRLRGPAYMGRPVSFSVREADGTAEVTGAQEGRLVLTGTLAGA
ncbi:MaoC family dehydratase N-terminal domain-containing protein [Knoellia locipacati]|uniref:N-terminal of MaoC-like dehydratase domain-containing protein n=2 Tax=Knoellia locipacati TaxID=882824 RepID=A0A512SXR7_9MICO|nr:hypothetical protein KLO01_08050 [Knoellia locipacati]